MVLLDLVYLSFFMSFQINSMMGRSHLCVLHTGLSDYLCKQKSHRIITINGKRNVWKCKPIFPTDTTAKDRNDWLKTIVVVVGGENNNGLRLLHSSVIHTLHAVYIVYKCIVYSA